MVGTKRNTANITALDTDGHSPVSPGWPVVSVVIVNWNTKELLRECLNSIKEAGGAVSREVIVIDNASQDGSVDMIAREFPEVRVVENASNRGFAAANNQGIRLARGRYVLLLNPDTRVLYGAIAKTVGFAESRPEVAVVGCRTLFPDGRLQYNCLMFPSLLNLVLSLTHLDKLFSSSRLFGRRRLKWWDYGSARVVDAVAGCFMLVRREAIEQVGLMDESYFMYSEEIDWCWRFRQHGWKTMYTPDGAIIHVCGGSSSQCVTDMLLLQRRSVLMFLERKSGMASRQIANAMFAVASALRLLFLTIRQLAGKSKAVAMQRQRALAAVRFHLFGQLPELPQTELISRA